MQMHVLTSFICDDLYCSIFSLHCLANSSGLHFQAQNKEYAHLKPTGFLYKIVCPIPPHGLLKPHVPHVLAINCKPHLPVFQPIILLVLYPTMPPWSPHRPAQVDITHLVSQAIACYLRPGWWIRNSWGFLSHHWGWLSRGPGDLYEIMYIYMIWYRDTIIMGQNSFQLACSKNNQQRNMLPIKYAGGSCRLIIEMIINYVMQGWNIKIMECH